MQIWQMYDLCGCFVSSNKRFIITGKANILTGQFICYENWHLAFITFRNIIIQKNEVVKQVPVISQHHCSFMFSGLCSVAVILKGFLYHFVRNSCGSWDVKWEVASIGLEEGQCDHPVSLLMYILCTCTVCIQYHGLSKGQAMLVLM